MSTKWRKAPETDGVYEGLDRVSGELKWRATPVDLVFGSHAELRAIAEVYAEDGGEQKFVSDFVDAWTKVMTLDRFDMTDSQAGEVVANR
jgi:catalase-peroxidase